MDLDVPVDIASGNVHLEFEDASIPGKVNLVWDRRYSGNLLNRPAGPLGPGWTNSYYATLTRHAGGFEFVSPSGSVELLPDREREVEQGGVVRDLGANLEISVQDGRYVVQSWGTDSGVRRYGFEPDQLSKPMRLVAIEDATGQALDLSWDDDGRLIEVRQRLEQRALRFDYETGGRLRSVFLQARGGTLHRLARYEYNATGRLSAAFDPLEHAHRYEYDPSGRLVRESARDGGVFSYRYDDRGRCVRTTGPDRYDDKRLRFLDAVRVTEVTDSRGFTSRFQYLPTGQVVTEWSPLGALTRTDYDAYGRIVCKTTPTGATTRYQYDDRGNVSTVTDPVGAKLSISYDDDHRPTVVEDALGGIWRRHYDSRGHLIRLEDPVGGTTSWEYDARGNRIRTAMPGGAVTEYSYRDDGTLHQVVNPDGGTRSVVFDDAGRPVMQVNAKGGTVQASYDARGQILEIRRPDGTVLAYQYDAGGNIVQMTDGVGNPTKFEWGPCGRLLRKIDPLGQAVSYEWGTEIGQLLAVVNESGERLSLTYDAAGRIAEEHSFDGRIRRFAYDASGALTRYAVGDDDTLEFSYDPCGRATARRLADGSREEYEYDLLGRLVVARNQHCTVRYAYDPLGNVVEECQDDVSTVTVFDDGGRLLRRRSSLGFDVTFSLDGSGRPVTIDVAGTRSFSFSYDATGSEVSRWLPGGLRLVQERDERGRVVRQSLTPSADHRPGSDVADLLSGGPSRSYRYDGNGAPTAIADRRLGTAAYGYDGAEQLLSADYGAQGWEKFDYTPTGSLRRLTSPYKDVSLVYGAGNRLLRYGDAEYDYDVPGRRIKKTGGASDEGDWAYSWDSLGRLRSVTVPSGDVWTYAYDALGRRIAKTGPKGTTRFVWCGDTVLHTVGSNGKVESWLYDDAALVPIAKVEDGRLYSVVPDHLGAPRELIDTAGTVMWSAKSSAWGDVVVSARSEVDCHIRFPGQWFDAESGLHYNRYRYFDPEIGQFISQDPIGIDGGLNLYRYAPNPLSYVDPLGLDVCANRKKGEDFKNAVRDELEKAGFIVVEEVSVRVDAPGGAVRTRVDLVVVDPSGNHTLIECKASERAPYTRNQETAGVAAGTLTGPAEYRSTTGPIDRGTAVPPGATVVTVRPGDPIPGTTATAPHPPPP